MNVAAIIVTRGDQDEGVRQIVAGLPEEWEVLVWDNGQEAVYAGRKEGLYWNTSDLSVYGRYAAIEYTDADLIYVQDDDCVVSDPQAIVDAYEFIARCPDHEFYETEYREVKGHWGWVCSHLAHRLPRFSPDAVVCNMPQEFRHEFYEEHALVGFGACFHRDAPNRAFGAFLDAHPNFSDEGAQRAWLNSTCDIVFTALTPRVLVDVPYENLPWAHYETRMWKQPGYLAERVRMLDLVRQIR